MKKISDFIKYEFPVTGPFNGVASIKKQLIAHSALLVQDEDSVLMGVLTPLDIIKRPHNLVIDCLSTKSSLNTEDSIENALQIMQNEQADVLPVYVDSQFQGLVFKRDLIDFVTNKKNDLEKKVEESTAELNHVNKNLEFSRRILNAIFNSTQSVIFLVSPDYKISFFNKKAFDISKVFYKKEIKIGEDIREYVAQSEKESYDIFIKFFEEALKGKNVVSEKEIRFDNAPSYWFQIEYFPVFEEDKIIGVAITCLDINERKKHELYIEKQNQVLRDISWTQSHKTRQPVATVLGLVSLIDKSDLSEKNKEIFNMLELTTQKLDIVIRETVGIANSLEDIIRKEKN